LECTLGVHLGPHPSFLTGDAPEDRERHSSAESGRMVGNGRGPSAISATQTRSAAASAQSALQGAASVHDFGDGLAQFHFDGHVDGVAYPSMSPAQQAGFKADFFREIASLKKWSLQQDWLPPPPAGFQVFLSDDYKISQSLVPASLGKRGRMEFPAWKAVAGEAAILHELVHVYFPNGNRLLAEGLAIYLQDRIGGNPSFPNFGTPLHEMVRQLAREMVPEFVCNKPESLENIRIAGLDKIASPSPLRLRVGRYLYDNTPAGQAHVYPIAGSFIQFLIERHGMEKFRALYARTPLVPFERDAGSPGRWIETYGLSLSDLELQWRSKIAG
jgi:hypothetical protein